MRASDLRDLSDAELTEHIQTARRELFGLRSQHAVNRALDNTAALQQARQEVARALTVARERTLESGQDNG
jgi:large subunit ribosomal protein L29